MDRPIWTRPGRVPDARAGDLVDNQMWQVPAAGYQTTSGYDATTGWGVPNAPAFVSDLTSEP